MCVSVRVCMRVCVHVYSCVVTFLMIACFISGVFDKDGWGDAKQKGCKLVRSQGFLQLSSTSTSTLFYIWQLPGRVPSARRARLGHDAED